MRVCPPTSPLRIVPVGGGVAGRAVQAPRQRSRTDRPQTSRAVSTSGAARRHRRVRSASQIARSSGLLQQRRPPARRGYARSNVRRANPRCGSRCPAPGITYSDSAPLSTTAATVAASRPMPPALRLHPVADRHTWTGTPATWNSSSSVTARFSAICVHEHGDHVPGAGEPLDGRACCRLLAVGSQIATTTGTDRTGWSLVASLPARRYRASRRDFLADGHAGGDHEVLGEAAPVPHSDTTDLDPAASQVSGPTSARNIIVAVSAR